MGACSSLFATLKESAMKKLSVFLSLVLIGSTGAAQAAEYTFGVEAEYPAAQAAEVYKPLLDYLKKSTGHTFKLKASRNYHAQWRAIMVNEPVDFVYEDAHFADYRMNRQGFLPLARNVENASYLLLAETSSSTVDQLIGMPIASMSSPSLGYLLLGENYRNPMQQPEVKSFAATWKDGVEMVFNQEAKAAMAPRFIAELYPNLNVVLRSREIPGRLVLASNKVPADVRKAVSNALLKIHTSNDGFTALNEIGTAQFVLPNRADYVGQERMLRSVFGYKALPARPATAPAAPAGKPAITPKPAAPVRKS
jgi:hypothetical protein